MNEIIHYRIKVYQKKGDHVTPIRDVTNVIKNLDAVTVYGVSPSSDVPRKLIFIGGEIIFYENDDNTEELK